MAAAVQQDTQIKWQLRRQAVLVLVLVLLLVLVLVLQRTCMAAEAAAALA
jgi:hypothetical protein